MKEYIEREELILNFESRYMDYRQRSETPIGGGRVAVDKDLQTAAVIMQSCLDTVRDMRSADVVDRKRGEWVVTECDGGEPEGYPAFIEFHCPFCNEPYSLESGEYDWFYGDAIPLKFCHECGSDMRGADHAD